jgi:hypothetical protein
MNPGKKSNRRNNNSSVNKSIVKSSRQGGDLTGYTGMVYNRVETSIRRQPRIERRTELVNYGTAASSNLAAVGGGLTFKISDCQGYAACQAAFDQYRIVGIEFMFKTMQGPAPPSITATANVHLLAAVDLDSATPPSVYGDIAQYDKKVRILLSPGQSGVLAFQPSPIGSLDTGTGAQLAQVMDPDVWIDFANDTVRYYGLKYLLTQDTTTTQLRWDLWAEITYECCSRN